VISEALFVTGLPVSKPPVWAPGWGVPLPIGDVREHWSPEALERKDREIIEVENFYRQPATEAATRLLQLLETPF
jgi:hypothetical protein